MCLRPDVDDAAFRWLSLPELPRPERMMLPVYLDHNATTPLHPAVRAAMLPWLEARFGNASSRHEYGRQARAALDEARQQVAAAVGAHPGEVIFTSSGTEANNLFLKGAAALMPTGCLAISAIEHASVRAPAQQLRRLGWQLATIAVDADGRIDGADFQRVLAERPVLVSLMLANNETGVVQDIVMLADRARAVGRPWLHCDAVQALGKLPIDFRALNAAGVHALSLSAHKLGGPQGVGALIVDKRVELSPLLAGGGQERDLRSGTENIAGIVGFAAACTSACAPEVLTARAKRLGALRDRLENGLRQLGATIFAAQAERLPNTCFFALPGLAGETLVMALDRAGYAVASGSACASEVAAPSPVLAAMGIPAVQALGAVRVSLGEGNDETQIDGFGAALRQIVVSLAPAIGAPIAGPMPA